MLLPARLAKTIGKFRRGAGGSVSMLAAGFGVCLIAALGLAVDVASFYLARRSDQGALDLAALAAARNIATAEASARAALSDNGVTSPSVLRIVFGRYDPDGHATPGGRFRASAAPMNAVQLEMTTVAPIYFSRALLAGQRPALTTRSIAVNTRIASFTIGTRLASLNGGLANALLSGLTGASVSLSVMDYEALASATVDMPQVLAALGPKVGVTAGTYDDVLTATPTVAQFAEALGAQTMSATARSALARIAQSGASRRVNLRQMLSFGPFGKMAIGQTTGVSAQVSALDALTTAIGIATAKHQVEVDLGAQVPGLLGLKLSVVIGERPQSSPWLAIGAEGVSVRTAQMRLRLVAKAGGALGLPSLNLPLAIDVAAGEATLSSARCGKNPKSDASVTLDVKPTLAELWVGEPRNPADWANPARPPDVGPGKVADALLLTATASAHVAAANMTPRAVTFYASDIANRTVKTVSTTNVLESTLASLTKDLAVSVELKLLGLALGTPKAVGQTLSAVLSPLGATLDVPLNQTLKLLGVGLGEADVTVRGLRCDGSALVG